MDTKHPPSLRDLYPNRLVHKCIYARIDLKSKKIDLLSKEYNLTIIYVNQYQNV